MKRKKIQVGFFVTCLVDTMRPSVAFASIKLLEENGCEVHVPQRQTCCGQPAFNSGDNETSIQIAKGVIDNFLDYDYVVAPSGSCLGMIKKDYPVLLDNEPEWLEKTLALSEKSYEIISFLDEILDASITASLEANVTYHDSCSSLRELDIRSQPRAMLDKVNGLNLIELEDRDVCCGFGGTFCVKFPDISNSLVSDKVERISETKAEYLLAGDLGCLLNIAGRCRRLDVPVRCMHTVEVLAGMTNHPAIAEVGLSGIKEKS